MILQNKYSILIDQGDECEEPGEHEEADGQPGHPLVASLRMRQGRGRDGWGAESPAPTAPCHYQGLWFHPLGPEEPVCFLFPCCRAGSLSEPTRSEGCWGHGPHHAGGLAPHLGPGSFHDPRDPDWLWNLFPKSRPPSSNLLSKW